MALTKIGKEGITGISNASDATFLTATSGEGVTLAGTLAVTGVHTVGTNAVATSDGGAVTTNIVQGLAKAWCAYNGSGTVAIDDSFNISGITDNSTGGYTPAINSDMSNTTYSPQSCGDQTGGVTSTCITNIVASVNTINVTCRQNGTTIDNDDMYLTVHGDLA
jgi:hypothetical protein